MDSETTAREQHDAASSEAAANSKENLSVFNELPHLREDLDYKWREVDLTMALGHFGRFLKRNDAKAFEVDVYATNDCVYRNIVIQLPEKGAFAAEDIHIQFNRDSGRQYSLGKNYGGS